MIDVCVRMMRCIVLAGKLHRVKPRQRDSDSVLIMRKVGKYSDALVKHCSGKQSDNQTPRRRSPDSHVRRRNGWKGKENIMVHVNVGIRNAPLTPLTKEYRVPRYVFPACSSKYWLLRYHATGDRMGDLVAKQCCSAG